MRSQSLLSLIWLLPLLVLVLFWEPAPGKNTERVSSQSTADLRAEPELHGSPLNHSLALEAADPSELMHQYELMGPMFIVDGWVYLADDRNPKQIQFRRLHPEFPVSRDDPVHLAQWRYFYHATEWGEWGQPRWLRDSVPAPMDQAFAHHPICRQYRCMVELNISSAGATAWQQQLIRHLSSGVSTEMRGGANHPLLVLTLNSRH
ncbi:hypothetical protein [Ferrimonas sp.]|uniref:hypothetical protein n=1 Tax=Ferrimonas sp. TaxID=2080861 RepID=UPI003A8E520E